METKKYNFNNFILTSKIEIILIIYDYSKKINIKYNLYWIIKY